MLACFSAERDIVHEQVWSSAANSINSEDYLIFNDSMVETRDHDAAVKCLKFFRVLFEVAQQDLLLAPNLWAGLIREHRLSRFKFYKLLRELD